MKIRLALVMAYLICGMLTLAQAATIQSISIGVNGLTCSMCTRSVEMSIRKLDFVDSVSMDLAQTEGIIFLKAGTQPDLRKVAKAITNAGFSVRFVHINVHFDEMPNQPCFSIGPDSFQWIDEIKNKQLSLSAELVLIGSEFMPRKELDRLKKKLTEQCPSKNGYYVAWL